MGTKFLDLDGLVEHSVTVRLNGVDHRYQEMSVGDFIWAQKRAATIEESTENDQIDSMIEIISRSFPTMKKEELLAVSMQQLSALMDFILEITGQKTTASETTEATEGEEGKAVAPDPEGQKS